MKVTAPPWVIVREEGLKVSKLVALMTDPEEFEPIVGEEGLLPHARGIKAAMPKTAYNNKVVYFFMGISFEQLTGSIDEYRPGMKELPRKAG